MEKKLQVSYKQITREQSIERSVECLLPGRPYVAWWRTCVLSHIRLCDPMDCSPPGFFVRGVFQARILERVAICYSRASSWPRDQTHISCVSLTGGRIADGFFYHWATWVAWGRHIQTDLGMRRRGMCVYERYLPAEITDHVTESSETGEYILEPGRSSMLQHKEKGMLVKYEVREQAEVSSLWSSEYLE